MWSQTAVLGMVVSADDNPEIAYMIPSATLSSFAGLAKPAVISGEGFHEQMISTIRRSYPQLECHHLSMSDKFREMDEIGFTGRRWILNEIYDFISTPSWNNGYVFVIGDAGVGKTMLATWLAATGDLASYSFFPHFVDSSYPETQNIDEALASLSVHLIAHHSLRDFVREDGTLHDSAAGPSGFRRVLEKAAERAGQDGKRIVLVIDGLEHARSSSPSAFPLGLPTKLPPNVYVVTTARKGTNLSARESPFCEIDLRLDHPCNLEDIKEHVARQLQTDEILRAKLGSRSAEIVVDTLAQRCGGLWIYLHHVLHDLRHNMSFDEINGLPNDLWVYYSRVLRPGDSTEDGESAPDPHLPILSALACARTAITVPTLLAFAGWSADKTDEVHTLLEEDRLAPFLRHDGTDYPGQRCYTTYHDSFRDFLVGGTPTMGAAGQPDLLRLLEERALDTQNRIKDHYLTAWGGLEGGLSALFDQPGAPSLDEWYGFRHLAAHFVAAGKAREFDKVLRSEQESGGCRINVWLEAHRRHHLLDWYRNDLDLAWFLAAETTDATPAGIKKNTIGLECRYALLAASCRSMAILLSPVLFAELVKRGLWDLPTALQYVHSVADINQRAHLLGAIAAYTPPEYVKDAAALISPARSLSQASTLLAVYNRGREPERTSTLGNCLAAALRLDAATRPRFVVQILGYLLQQPCAATLETLLQPDVNLLTEVHAELVELIEDRDTNAWIAHGSSRSEPLGPPGGSRQDFLDCAWMVRDVVRARIQRLYPEQPGLHEGPYRSKQAVIEARMSTLFSPDRLNPHDGGFGFKCQRSSYSPSVRG